MTGILRILVIAASASDDGNPQKRSSPFMPIASWPYFASSQGDGTPTRIACEKSGD